MVVYLRKLQFVGSIHIELSGYEADIILNGTNAVRAREHDHLEGRISQGEHALRRILMRAKEPFGRISVYPAGHEDAASPVFVDKVIAAGARRMAAGRGDRPATHLMQIKPLVGQNNVNSDFETLLDLASELLRTIDESLAKGRLNFSEAFKNACSDLAVEYPFLDSENENFRYQNGEIRVNGFVDESFFVSGIMAALRIVMARLDGKHSFTKTYNFTIQRIRTVMRDHKRLCYRFGISAELEKILNGR